MIQQILTFLLLIAILTACAPSADEVSQPAVTPTGISDALHQDAQMMAEDLGITVEEAIERMILQDSIGALNATLQEQEPETFGGLWIQNEPEYAVVVAFTRDGEETIQPYVEGTPLEDRIQVRQVDVSQTELAEAQDHLMQVLGVLEMPFSTGINLMQNTVELYVTDLELWETTLQRTRIALPDHFTVVEIYQPVGDNPPFDIAPVSDVFMPMLRVRSSAFMGALLTGTFTVEDGCLRVTNEVTGESHLVIWQPDYYMNATDDEIEILDREGQVVAKVGEEIRLGGGEISTPPSTQLREPIPEQCTGPYWLMGDLLPSD